LQIRISQPQLLLQNRDLRVLAAEAENGGSGDVGMIDVSGEEAAEIVGIFARAAAAAFVRQEFDAVDVREKP